MPIRKKRRVKKKRKTTKGALIKGMSRLLPSDMLFNPIFREKLRELMRGSAGIYALYRKNKLYYVGLTTNLFGRVKHHMKDRHSNRWDHFVIFRIKKVGYLKDIETLLTHVVDLPGNRQKGKIPRDGDINRVLKQLLTEHKRETRLLEKALKRK